MKIKGFLVAVVAFLFGVIAGGLMYKYLAAPEENQANDEIQDDQTSEGTDSEQYQENTDDSESEIEIAEKGENFELSKNVAVYLVWWDQDNGFEVIKDNVENISRVNPFWYKAEADGSITKFTGAEDKEIIDFCKHNGIEIMPVITNDHDTIVGQSIISNDDILETHVQNINTLVEQNGYDGIEIDYESLEAKDREDYSAFVEALSEELHTNDKLISTAVHAKMTDEGTWGGPEAQDWEVIGNSCDSVKIMTYDYHWSTSEAGDIAPLSWMQDVYDYAVTVIPKEKIYVGVHFYGYDWVDMVGTDLTYEDVQTRISRYSPDIYTSDEGEKYFSYSLDDEKHTVYFSDSEVVQTRVALADEYDLGGIGIWCIGKEDPDNWEVIRGELE